MPSTRDEFRALWRLALPIVGVNLGTMLLGLVDTLMVGHLSQEALAAATLANAWLHGTLLFFMGIVFGLDPIVSQAHGAQDGERAGLALQRGIVVALLVCIPLGILWTYTEPFLLLAGQSAELARAAHRYTLVQIPSLPFFMVFIAMRQYLQGRGIIRPALFVILVSNLFNVFFNWTLIFGRLGMPALGLEGAGISTALTRGVMWLGLLFVFKAYQLHHGAWVPWSRRAIDLRGLAEVLRFGLPVGLQHALEVWAFAAATLMAGVLGTTAVAAHAVVLNMASLSFMVPMGISFSAVTRVGNLIGRGQHAHAQRAAWVALGLGAGVMSLAAVAFATLRHWLPTLYTSEPRVIALCAAILPIAAAFQVFDGIQVVGAGILRGMGRTLPAAWFNLLAYWMLALPLAWWLAFERGLRLQGIWWGLALGLAIVAVLLLVWIRYRGPASTGPGTSVRPD